MPIDGKREHGVTFLPASPARDPTPPDKVYYLILSAISARRASVWWPPSTAP